MGADGLVDATPRALAAVVVAHVETGAPRRTTGDWSDWGDPAVLEAQVEYGVNPEGTENGDARTVRVTVRDLEAVAASDRKWFRCRAAEEGRCEAASVAGGRLLYRWYPGMEEEEPGSYAWTVVRGSEVVTVSYDGSGLFDSDPRELGLEVEPSDLRAAALDPAMSLRTTPAFHAAGRELDHYEGEESPPEQPTEVTTTPRQLADRVSDYVGRRPSSIRRSSLRGFGPDAVGVHLDYPATRHTAAFTLEVLTVAGRVPQVDPLPCAVQRVRTSEQGCFAWSRETATTWTLATGGRPGRQWIIGFHEDEQFNRTESVAVLLTSDAIDHNPFRPEQDPGGPPLPTMLMGDLSAMTSDLSIGPERAVVG